jgi:hypothetical protein
MSHQESCPTGKEVLVYGDVLGTTAAGGAAGAAAAGALPFTGYGITIAGVTITLSWLIAFALVAVAVGVLLIRWDARRG